MFKVLWVPPVNSKYTLSDLVDSIPSLARPILFRVYVARAVIINALSVFVLMGRDRTWAIYYLVDWDQRQRLPQIPVSTGYIITIASIFG